MNTVKHWPAIGYIIGCCLLAFAVGACGDKEIFTAELPSLSITTEDGEGAPVNLDIPAAGGSKTFSVASNGNWNITKQGNTTDWVTVTPDKSGTASEITVLIEPNTSEQARKVTLRFAMDGVQVKAMSISQLGYVPSIAVSPKPEEPFTYKGADVTFTVTTNDDAWKYTIEEGADWLTEKERTASTLTLTISGNSGVSPRTANITFSLENYEIADVVQLLQEGKKLEGYKTKIYGTKLWMIENLNEAGEDGNLGWAYSDPQKTARYGRLYTWHEAMTGIPNATAANNPFATPGASGIDDAGNPYIMDGTYTNSYNIQVQGACPEGWHVPNMNDWYDLLVAIKDEYHIPANVLSDVGSTKDGYIIAWGRQTGVVNPMNLTNWGMVGAYLKGSSPQSAGGLWEGGTTFYYGGNTSLGFPAGDYPLYKNLSSDIAFNILPSGYKINNGGNLVEEGRYSYHWVAYHRGASNQNPLRLTVGHNSVNFSIGWPNPLDGMCLRCVANY